MLKENNGDKYLSFSTSFSLHKIQASCAFIYSLFLLGSKLIHPLARALSEILVLPPYYTLHTAGAHSLRGHAEMLQEGCILEGVVFI